MRLECEDHGRQENSITVSTNSRTFITENSGLYGFCILPGDPTLLWYSILIASFAVILDDVAAASLTLVKEKEAMILV